MYVLEPNFIKISVKIALSSNRLANITWNNDVGINDGFRSEFQQHKHPR